MSRLGTCSKLLARPLLAKTIGVGSLCATLLIGVYSAVGLMDTFDPGYYSVEWYLHQREEKYLEHLERYADYVEVPELGDILVFKFGRSHAHSGIVVGGDRFVHAWMRDGRVSVQVRNVFWDQHQSRVMRAKGL